MERNFAVVAIDETSDWVDADLVRACGGRIWTLYLYDPNVHTYCCELTPSYYLEPVAVEAAGPLPEDDREREALLERLDEGLRQTDDAQYFHAHRIDAMPEALRYVFPVEVDDAAPGSVESYDAARELWQANPVEPHGIFA